MGSHIATLLLRLFLMYMPQVIEAGKVYSAVPPLFGIKQGRHMRYFTDNQELARYGQSLFSKAYQLTDVNGKAIGPRELVKIFTINLEYARNMNILADTLAVDCLLLETVLFELARLVRFNVDTQMVMAMAQNKIPLAEMKTVSEIASSNEDPGVKAIIDKSVSQAISYTIDSIDFKKFKSYMEKRYKFIEVMRRDGVIIIQGLVNNLYQYIFINDNTIRLCLDMIRQISNNENNWFKMNGNIVSMYTVINTLDSILPKDIKRYKGLGEQNANELRESTMSIDSRTLIRYTLESAKEEIENIRYIDSNRSALLNGLNITRQDIE